MMAGLLHWLSSMPASLSVCLLIACRLGCCMAAIGGEPDPAPGVLQVLDVSRCPNVGRDALDLHPRVGGCAIKSALGRLSNSRQPVARILLRLICAAIFCQ